VSENMDFYRSNMDRLEVVEMDLVESDTEPMLDAIAKDTAKLLSR
jgi:hypothetical protein